MKKILSAVIASGLFVLSFAANATTITFNPLEVPGPGFTQLPSYQESSYLFTSEQNRFSSAQQDNRLFYMGSAGLFADDDLDVITLQRVGGGVFSLLSIDLAPLSILYGTGATVSFVGNVHGGGTVNTTVKLHDSYDFRTYALNGFSNLDSVMWRQEYTYHQFDNLLLAEEGGTQPSPVPEPASLALTGLALAALGVVRRRKQ